MYKTINIRELLNIPINISGGVLAIATLSTWLSLTYTKAAYSTVYILPPDIDHYKHMSADTYQLLIHNICNPSNTNLALIPDCFTSSSTYISSATAQGYYSYTSLANQSITTPHTIQNALIKSSSIIAESTSFCFNQNDTGLPSGLVSTCSGSICCVDIANFSRRWFQAIRVYATYTNGAVVSGSSESVGTVSCSVGTPINIIYAPIGSCTYPQNMANLNPCSSDTSTAFCLNNNQINLNYHCFFGSSSNTALNGTFYTNITIVSLCEE